MKLLFNTVTTTGYEIDKNFYETFKDLGFETIKFNSTEHNIKFGKKKTDEILIELVNTNKPDVIFTFLNKYEISKNTFKKIKAKSISLAWFADDHWRYNIYSKYMAPFFDYCLTTSKTAFEHYKRDGFGNVIKTQWAANPRYYKNLDLEKIYDVSFIGYKYGIRPHIINTIKNNRINIKVFGKGWTELPVRKKINKKIKGIFKINTLRELSFFEQILNKFQVTSFFKPQKENESKFISFSKLVRLYNISKINLNLAESSANEKILQIKGRNFEIPMCGGLILTKYIPELTEYYDIGEEIICYENLNDLINKINYFLKHEEEREDVAKRGYERSIKEHTYEKRFKTIFNEIGIF